MRFITLTLRSTDAALSSQVDRLFACFRRLRKTALWRWHVAGGVSFLEVTFNPQREQWHPHLHILATGRYLPYDQLRETWHAITGDSWVVDIRPAKREGDVLRYVTGYVTKAVKPAITRHPGRFAECIAALTGRTMATTFGSFRGVPLRGVDEAPVGRAVCSLIDLIYRAQGGDPWAGKVLHALRRRALSCKGPRGQPP